MPKEEPDVALSTNIQRLSTSTSPSQERLSTNFSTLRRFWRRPPQITLNWLGSALDYPPYCSPESPYGMGQCSLTHWILLKLRFLDRGSSPFVSIFGLGIVELDGVRDQLPPRGEGELVVLLPIVSC